MYRYLLFLLNIHFIEKLLTFFDKYLTTFRVLQIDYQLFTSQSDNTQTLFYPNQNYGIGFDHQKLLDY